MDYEDALRCEPEIERNLTAAWKAAIRAYGCIACASLDLKQRLTLVARAQEWNTDAVSSSADDAAPVAGVCANCKAPTPEDAVRFFKAGTDDLS